MHHKPRICSVVFVITRMGGKVSGRAMAFESSLDCKGKESHSGPYNFHTKIPIVLPFPSPYLSIDVLLLTEKNCLEHFLNFHFNSYSKLLVPLKIGNCFHVIFSVLIFFTKLQKHFFSLILFYQKIEFEK